MTLQLLVSTIDRGIDNVCRLVLPPAADISYVVSWQHSAPDTARTLPSALQRDDIKVVHLEGRGLSRNRNNCLRHASADICLICDDDCRYTEQGLRSIIETFSANPSTDLATFMMHSPGMSKRYPAASCHLTHAITGYYPSSVEMAFRRQSIQGRLQFNEHFGLGAERFLCSEEEIFLHDAQTLGLHCHFYRLTIVEHDHPTTETARATHPGVLMGKGAFLYIGYRSKMLLYPLPIAWRLHRQHGTSMLYGLRYLYKGLFHILRYPYLASAGIVNQKRPIDN